MSLEQRKSPHLEMRVGSKGLIDISKPPFLRVVMIYTFFNSSIAYSANLESC